MHMEMDVLRIFLIILRWGHIIAFWSNTKKRISGSFK